MDDTHQPFAPYALQVSAGHEQFFRTKRLEPEHTREFVEMAEASLAQQKKLESGEQIPFDDFLYRYFSQN